MIVLSDIPTGDLRAELLHRISSRNGNPQSRRAHSLVSRAAKSYGLTPSDVIGRRRSTNHCHARWAVWTVLAYGGWNPSIIATVFSVDRGTVENGLLRAGMLVASDDLFLGTLLVLLSEPSDKTNPQT